MYTSCVVEKNLTRNKEAIMQNEYLDTFRQILKRTDEVLDTNCRFEQTKALLSIHNTVLLTIDEIEESERTVGSLLLDRVTVVVPD